MARKAMSVGIAQNDDIEFISKIGVKKVREIEHLLEQYRAGLEAVKDFDHPIHLSIDLFCYGPFQWGIPIEKWRFKKQNVLQAGLIFHLSYLFRYFTCAELPEPLDARFKGWELEFYGPMLECGAPHTELVAPLVNAVFNTKLTTTQVMHRLKDLRRRKSKGSRHINRPAFIGWSLHP
jgi:hypothetical protein